MKGLLTRAPALAILLALLGSCFDDKVTIVDNSAGGTPVVTIVAIDGNASETGDTGTFALSRAGDTSQALTVNVAVGGTATEGVDYNTIGTGVSIPAGSSLAFVVITPVADALVEGTETVAITVNAGAAYIVGTPSIATVTIADAAGPPSVGIAAVDGNASESGDTGTLAVTRTGDASQALIVNFTVGGTATQGVDYASIGTTVTIPAGAFIAFVTISPLADGAVEPDETVVVTLAAGAGYTLGAPLSATVTISDGVIPTFTTPETPVGLSGIDNAALAADLGSDGEPRLVYRFGDNQGSFNTQLRLVRRRTSGTWTTPVAISTNDTEFKNSVTAFVSRNNNFTHVFWLQTPTAVFDPRLHYAQFDNSDPPVATVPDTNISTGPATNLSVGAAFFDVIEFSAAIDRTNNNIAVVYSQDVNDGPSGNIPIVGLVIGGAGLFSERFALVSPPTAGAGQTPLVRVGPAGAFHVLFGAAVHRLRTAVSTWSAPNTFGTNALKDLVIAADGDAYAVIGASVAVQAFYRPAGAATTFSAPSNLPFSANGLAQPRLKAVLEPGTEHLHVFLDEATAQAAAPATAVHAAPNLSGAWSPAIILHTTVAGPSDPPGEYLAFADASNTVTVVFRAPFDTGGLGGNVLTRSRPTGAASVYGPLTDLTASGSFPMIELALAQNPAGTAFVAWREGNLPSAGPFLPAEVFARQCVGGVWSSPADNVSRSPTLPSHGRLILLLSDTGVQHIFWNEVTNPGGGQANDVFYARK